MSSGGVRLQVLGPVLVDGPGGRLDLGSRRHREVLAALAVDAGHVVPAEVVMSRLWGDVGQGSATNLHALVSRLRGRLREVTPESVVVTEPPGYRLALDTCEVDAVQLVDGVVAARRMLAEGDLDGAHTVASSALALWRGRPYADVRGDFADVEADRLEEQRMACHELLAETDLALGRHERLVDTLPALLAEQPLREPLHHALMLALYRSGRQADALTTYDRARGLLADELGIDPGPDLQRLHARILQQDPELLPAVEPASPASPASAVLPGRAAVEPTRPLIVGREHELAALDALVGGPGFAVVVGEPGIGKSHLVDALVEQVSRRPEPPVVVTGACWDDEGASALWPWEQALSALVETVGPEAVAAAASPVPGALAQLGVLVPSLGEGRATWGGDADRARLRLFDAVARLLHDLATQRPVLVVLEDVHAADEESLALLRYLARSRRTGRVCVVVTTRDVDGPGPAADVQATVSRAGGLVLPLTGLHQDDVARLVEHHLGSSLRPGVAASLRERTDGNPFYLVELTRLLGQERRDGGRADVPVPRSITAVVESRLRGQSADDREVLGAAAVIGRDVDLALLEDVLGRPAGALAGALDRAAAAGLLVPGREPGVQRFSHALVQEVLEGGIGPMRRATWHAQVAEALTRRYVGDGAGVTDTSRIAHHHLQAGAIGDAAEAVRFTMLAADQAEARLALHDAERLMRAALDVVPRLAPAVGEPLELEVRIRLAALLSQRFGYDHEEIGVQRRRSVELATRLDNADRLLAGIWGLWGSALVSGGLAQAEAMLPEVAAAAESTHSPWLSVARAQATGQVLLLRGRLAEARAELEQGIVLVDDLPPAPLDLFVQDPGAALRGWLVLVLTLAGAPEAESTTRAVRRLLDRLDHAYTTVYVELILAWCAVFRDDPDEAGRAGDLAVDTARSAGFEQFALFGRPPSAWALGCEDTPGATRLGLEQATAVAATYVEPGHHMLGTLISSVQADLLLRSGRADDALAVLDRAIATARTSGEQLVLADLHRRRGECLLALGRDRAAALALDAATAVARGQGAGLLLDRAEAVRKHAASTTGQGENSTIHH